MIKNRYDGNLRENNHIIIDLIPSNYTMRIELALELKKILAGNPNLKILEIGSGEGNLTKHILKNNKFVNIDCLDVSSEMIDRSKLLLEKFLERINFISEDALDYLEKIKFKYDVITSAWTIHNFNWNDKMKALENIYSRLSMGGFFLMMDKIYPNSNKDSEILLKLQIDRYRYIDKDLRKEMIDHEKQDFLREYKMEESQTIEALKKIGFKDIKILDRIEREVLFIAKK